MLRPEREETSTKKAPERAQRAPAPSSADYSAAEVRRVPDELAGVRLDQALARMFPEHSRSRMQAWLREGRVTVDAARPTGNAGKRKVWGGERVRVEPAADPRASAFGPEAIALNVVYEDDAILVIDKPAGLVVHPGSGNWRGTLLNAILHHAPRNAALPRAGIVHRLDKDTSGLLVVAKTLAAQTDLARQLHARSVRREYLALVHGALRVGGTVDAPIGRHPVARTRMAVAARGKPARTRYAVLRRFRGATLVECRLETGRTHQIRVHMDSIGHPLVGDPVYGRRAAGTPAALATFPRQALHAARLALTHPVTRAEVGWTSPLPADLRALLDALG
ncbi:MAG: 23S rRNA pseudouridine(1911/1915/1917) synthase RluD [Burkholderiales bacterium]|nr:23S rRNA pseudouridine(1911/1915/1917) synthase RluD [Burkholderiales bacterium]